MKDSLAMKEDILDSMDIILHETDEAQFRPIILSYK